MLTLPRSLRSKNRCRSAINGKDQKAPIDRDWFNKLVYRCKEFNDEVRVLQTKLAESKGQKDMVEDLQRQLLSFEDLHESQAADPPVLPVFTRNEEVPSSS
eukprot:12055468-Heterocapsa_arctica.AAC.1